MKVNNTRERRRGMFVMLRPRSDGDGFVRREVLQWRCHVCTRTFRTLTEIFLCYEPPHVGQRAAIVWLLRRCPAAQPPAPGVRCQLWRADCALKALLETLVKPAIPLAVLREARRPWGDP